MITIFFMAIFQNAGYICSGCESDLSVAYDFQRRCEKSISSWTIKNCKEEDDRTVTDVRPFTCDFCLQKFTTKGNLETHVKRHTQKKGQYSCKKCALRFLVKTHFQQHVATHFGNNQKK